LLFALTLTLTCLLTKYLVEDGDTNKESKTDDEDNEEETEESNKDKEEEAEKSIKDKPNPITPPVKKKLPVKAAITTTASPKKNKPAAKTTSIDSIAEDIGGLSVGYRTTIVDPLFVRGPYTKEEGKYIFDYCKVDIYIGTLIPQEYLQAVLSPEGTHIIYKKAVPEMFGKATRVKREMGTKKAWTTCVFLHTMTSAN
jgi:hypothetical protein